MSQGLRKAWSILLRRALFWKINGLHPLASLLEAGLGNERGDGVSTSLDCGGRPRPRLSSAVAARIRADAGAPLSFMMVTSVVMASSVYFLATLASDMWRTAPRRPTAPRGRPAPLRLPPWLLPEGIWCLLSLGISAILIFKMGCPTRDWST
jgi:hypothetical protein